MAEAVNISSLQGVVCRASASDDLQEPLGHFRNVPADSPHAARGLHYTAAPPFKTWEEPLTSSSSSHLETRGLLAKRVQSLMASTASPPPSPRADEAQPPPVLGLCPLPQPRWGL